MFVLRDRWANLTLDTSAQLTLNVAFFTTIGMGASLTLLRRGGMAVLVFLLFAIAVCFVQNGVGVAIATAFGQSPLLGLMAGSVTLVGGPATGLAFAPLFESAGLDGAAVIAITAAVFGIVCGGVTGNPLGTALIRRHRLSPRSTSRVSSRRSWPFPTIIRPANCASRSSGRTPRIVRNLVVLAVAMGLGSLLSR